MKLLPLTKKMNKRAQIFTLIAIATIGLMLISFEIFSIVQQRQPIKARISSMESFLDSIEENLERQIYIIGFRIIFLAEDEITRSGNYVNDIDLFFNEAFFNGTVGGEEKDILIGVTYKDLVDSINQKAKKINVDIALSNSKIYVSQDDPWHVKLSLMSDFIMEDKTGLAKWEKQQEISSYIPIGYFEDPVYTINTNALVARKINQTIYEGQYTDGIDISNLLSHIDKGYYAANPGAPSFLKRLQGNLSSDENGIESFVDLNELSRQGLPTYTKSYVDYIYFSSNNPTFYSVTGMPSWFKIDSQNEHLQKYNVTELTF